MVAGTIGTAHPRRPLHPCPSTSGSIPETVIREPSSSSCSAARTTAISRATLWPDSSFRNMSRRGRRCLFRQGRTDRSKIEVQGSRRPTAPALRPLRNTSPSPPSRAPGRPSRAVTTLRGRYQHQGRKGNGGNRLRRVRRARVGSRSQALPSGRRRHPGQPRTALRRARNRRTSRGVGVARTKARTRTAAKAKSGGHPAATSVMRRSVVRFSSDARKRSPRDREPASGGPENEAAA